MRELFHPAVACEQVLVSESRAQALLSGFSRWHGSEFTNDVTFSVTTVSYHADSYSHTYFLLGVARLCSVVLKTFQAPGKLL